MSAARSRYTVLIAHAEGDEDVAEELAGPIRAAGYDVAHRGTVLVGTSVLEDASKVLADGGPVVLCGTVRAMGTAWAHQVVTAASAHPGVQVFGVQVEEAAYLRYLTLAAEVAEYWRDPRRAVAELLTALAQHYPLAGSPTVSVAAAEARLRDVMLATCDILDLTNLPVDREVATRQLMLRSLFVPLQLRLDSELDRELPPYELVALEGRRRSAPGRRSSDPLSSSPSDRRAPAPAVRDAGPALVRPALVDLGRRLQQSRQLVVLGGPGAGKSTLLRWVATAYLLRLRSDPSWASLPAVDTLPDEDLFPILVRCRDLTDAQLTGSLQDVVEFTLQRSELPRGDVETLRAAVSARLADGTALLLVDGLDEITDAGTRLRFSRQLEQVHLARPGTPIIATSRIVGYREMGYRIGRGFEHLTIADLTPAAKDDFVRRWCRATEPPDRQRTVAGQLIADLHSTDQIDRLTATPLMLTTMALVKRRVGKLPDRRAQLYEQAVQVLLNWRSEVGGPLDEREALPQLEYLAYAMASRGVQQLTDEELEELLDGMRAEYPTLHPVHQRSARDFLRLLEDRTGLLEQAGHVRRPGRLAPVYEFRHLTFQEYLAALALVEGRFPGRDRARGLPENVGLLAGRATGDQGEPTADGWRESLRLCATICLDDDVDAVLRAILEPGPDGPDGSAGARAVLAAECLVDEPLASDEVSGAIIGRLVEELPADDEPSAVSDAVVALGRTRWSGVVVDHLTRELRSRGPRAVPSIGRLSGQVRAQAAPDDDAGFAIWVAAETAAVTGPPGSLAAVLALAEAAARRGTADWSGAPAAAEALLPLVGSAEPVTAAAAATALAELRQLPAEHGWHPSDADTDRLVRALRTRGAGAWLAALATAIGPSRRPEVADALGAAVADPDPAGRAALAGALGLTYDERAGAPLLALLADPVPSVRRASAAALVGSGAPDAVAALVAALADEDAGVRITAATALGQLRDLGPAATLHQLAVGDDPVLSAWAAAALAELGDGRALAPLLAALDRDDLSGAPAELVISALGRFGDDRAVEPLLRELAGDRAGFHPAVVDALGDLGDCRATEALLGVVRGADPDLRARAATSLGQLGAGVAEEAVIALLSDPEADVRSAAAHALATIVVRGADGPLTAALDDPVPQVRAAAAATIGQRVPVLDRLVAALADPDSRVRCAVASALGDADDNRAVPALAGATGDPHPAVRAAAVRALGEIEDVAGLGPVLAALDDPVPMVREAAIDSVVPFKLAAPLPAVRRRLSDRDTLVRSSALGAVGQLQDVRSRAGMEWRLAQPGSVIERYWAAWGLGELGDGRALPGLSAAAVGPQRLVRRFATQQLPRYDVDAVIPMLLGQLADPDLDVRLSAYDALGAAGDPRARGPLVEGLRDPNRAERAAAARTLDEIADVGDAAAAALAGCLTDPDPEVRKNAVWGLGALRQLPAVPDLVARLADRAPEVAANAVWALGVVGGPELVTTVAPELDGPHPSARGRAAQALARLDRRGAVPHLARALADPVPTVRQHAARGLGLSADAAALPPLLAALHDPVGWVRWTTARALGVLGEPAALEPLLGALGDPCPMVRCEAARALGQLGDPAASAGLSRLAADADPWLRTVAAGALVHLGDPSPAETLRPLLRSTVGSVRRRVVVVLAGRGDPHCGRLLAAGLRMPSLPRQREWVQVWAEARADGLDGRLLSEYGDGIEPWLPARAVITPRRVERVARLTGLEPADVERRYRAMARTVPLRFT